jgi:hypothetical protein
MKKKKNEQPVNNHDQNDDLKKCCQRFKAPFFYIDSADRSIRSRPAASQVPPRATNRRKGNGSSSSYGTQCGYL